MGLRNNGADRAVNSGELVKSLIVHAGPCRIYDIVVFSTNAGKVFAQLHDSATVPAALAVPIGWVELDPSLGGTETAIGSIPYFGGRPMRNGAVVVLSSTKATYTALATDDALIDATFTPHA
jgi:hypothetical protein